MTIAWDSYLGRPLTLRGFICNVTKCFLIGHLYEGQLDVGDDDGRRLSPFKQT